MTDRSVGSGPFAGESIATLGGALRAGKVTSVELVTRALEAAETIGAVINCFVTLDREGALAHAAMLDAELADEKDRGPLHGIPTAVKDLIDTAGVVTTMGSRHFEHHVPEQDAAVVVALRNAGAVIIGKAHTHQFAYGPTGDRAHTGAALNPYDHRLMTGGSSSGSAAAVAAGLVPFAIGTDTAGSVRIPSAMCGTVGLKPSSHIISTDGVFPFGPSFDTVGPIAASVADTYTVLEALSGSSVIRQTDVSVAPGPWSAGVVACDLMSEMDAFVSHAFEAALAAIRELGVFVDTVSLPEVDETTHAHLSMLSAESVAIHHDMMERQPHLYDPEVLDRLRAASEIPGWRYVDALQGRPRLQAVVAERLGDRDVLLMPTVPIKTPHADFDGGVPAEERAYQRATLKLFTVPWSFLDFPVVTIPMWGPGEELPAALQVIGRPGRDIDLLPIASAIQSALGKAANMSDPRED